MNVIIQPISIGRMLPSSNLSGLAEPNLSIYAPVIYTAQYVVVLMRANAFTRARGRRLEPGNQEFFRPCEMAASR